MTQTLVITSNVSWNFSTQAIDAVVLIFEQKYLEKFSVSKNANKISALFRAPTVIGLL